MTDVGTVELGDAGAVEANLGTEGIESVEVPTETVEGTPNVDAPGATGSEGGTYTVKVGGVDQTVTLEDLQSGYMRHADYTRKTQEVSEMRQRLAQAESIASALDADPSGTLQALAEAFGVQLGNPPEGFEPEEVDPFDQRLKGIESTLQKQKAAEVRTQINTEIDTLVSTYGDFDITPVIAHAAQNGMTVTDAYRVLNFDAINAKAADAERIKNEKRGAAVVEGGAHRTGITPGNGKPANSIREAWAQAKQTLGK
jgi:hypothetical protein